MNVRLLLLLALTSLALGLAACGDDDDESGGATTPTVAETTDTTAADEPEEISTNLEAKPEIGKPSGDPPTKLVKEDIVVGKGRKAKEGDQVTVHYVGVNFSTGDQFDASWDRGEPTSFTLAKGRLIDGWVQGMKGMRVGGRRKLVIPPELGYGEAGSPPAIPPNETLVFVIDLKKIG
ncbi:MAG TPA: FKBP-type peptidyl-prolyl cis-trans isomerase [Solirubrobacteraceae bacterium]|jgi:peptidylprolyl isomerase